MKAVLYKKQPNTMSADKLRIDQLGIITEGRYKDEIIHKIVLVGGKTIITSLSGHCWEESSTTKLIIRVLEHGEKIIVQA